MSALEGRCIGLRKGKDTHELPLMLQRRRLREDDVDGDQHHVKPSLLQQEVGSEIRLRLTRQQEGMDKHRVVFRVTDLLRQLNRADKGEKGFILIENCSVHGKHENMPPLLNVRVDSLLWSLPRCETASTSTVQAPQKLGGSIRPVPRTTSTMPAYCKLTL